jgi:hypothetical protein
MFSKGPNVNGAPYINCGLICNNGSSAFEFNIANAGSSIVGLNSGVVPTAGVWYHLVGTYDGTTMRLYVNGAQVATTGQSGNILASAEPLMIGAARRGGVVQEYFPGTVNDCALYNAVLDATTILQHYFARTVVCVAATGRSQAFVIG